MGGIISGFLKGAGQAAGEAGTMMLADQLAKERDEANWLRDSSLRKDLAAARQGHLSGENKKRREYDTTSATTEDERRVLAAKTKSTTDAETAKKLHESNLARDKAKPRDAEWIDVDGGNGLVVQARYIGGGQYELPQAGGTSRVIEPSTASKAQAAAEWKEYKKANSNMLGLGGTSGAKEATGYTEREFMAKRSVEIELENRGNSTPPPKDEAVTDNAPTVTPFVASKEAKGDPNKTYSEWIAARPNADKKKIEKAIQEGGFPDWKAPIDIDLNPVSDASADDDVVPPPAEPEPEKEPTTAIVSGQRVNHAEKVEPEKVEKPSTDIVSGERGAMTEDERRVEKQEAKVIENTKESLPELRAKIKSAQAALDTAKGRQKTINKGRLAEAEQDLAKAESRIKRYEARTESAK
jgi:hypothetical protein